MNLLAPLEPRLDSGLAPESVSIRTSRRARRLRIQVHCTGSVEVVVPERTRPATVAAFIHEHREWIDRTSRRYREQRGAEPLLPERIHLRAIGHEFAVHYRQGADGRARASGERLMIEAPMLDVRHCWPVLQRWLKRTARPHLECELAALAAELSMQPKRLHIRLQRTRWGSCSSTGTISLNAAVLLRPPEEMRYVIIHELCHLRHMNHSARFWRLVERYAPDYRDHERALDAAWPASPLWLVGKG